MRSSTMAQIMIRGNVPKAGELLVLVDEIREETELLEKRDPFVPDDPPRGIFRISQTQS